MTKLLNRTSKNEYILKAEIKTTLQDKTKVDDSLAVEVRGNFRLKHCYLPPVKLIFNYYKGSAFHDLKKLKLVNVCKITENYDQYVLKEFLIYRIYNLLTPKSFRVRLINLNWVDSADSGNVISTHAFLLEDIKNVANRNDCSVWMKSYVQQEATNHQQMTLLSLFQYMIGNTDWSVPGMHNIRLISSIHESHSSPFAIPYDFDWTGFVNADYAYPDERLGIKSVKDRLYMGYRQDFTELKNIFEIFIQKKVLIYSLINNFNLLTSSSKGSLINYLDQFYKTINNQKLAKYIFIDKARSHRL
jgi:hypothetical protein